MTTPIVFITGLQCANNPSPGVAVARCLKSAGYRTLGIAYSAIETGAYAPDVFDHVVRLSKPEKNVTLYFQQLNHLINHFRPLLIIPTLDPEIPLFVSYSDWLKKNGIAMLLPSKDALNRTHKLRLPEFAKKIGFRTPKQELVSSISETKRAIKRFGLPVMLKGQWYEAHEIKFMDEVPYFFRELKKRWKLPILVQQKIGGSEITAACLCDRSSVLAQWLMMRKWGQSSQGTTWCGVTFSNPDFVETLQNLLQELQWVGPCEIEFFLDDRTGLLTLFEFNMRLPSWIYVSVDAGNNFPVEMIKISMGEKSYVKREPATGKVFFRVAMDHVVPVQTVISLEKLGKIDAKAKIHEANN